MHKTVRVQIACLCALGSALAAEHRAEVAADWAFQHRYATTVDKAGKMALRNDRSPAPLVDEQAGTLKSDRDPTDQEARRSDALLAHLAKTFPGKGEWAAFRQRLDPLLAEAKSSAPDLTGKDPARQGTYIALCAAAEEKPPRDAAACGSPLASYDPERELGLGEAKAEILPVLDRLAPLAEGDDRDAKALKAKIEAKRKELEGGQR